MIKCLSMFDNCVSSFLQDFVSSYLEESIWTCLVLSTDLYQSTLRRSISLSRKANDQDSEIARVCMRWIPTVYWKGKPDWIGVTNLTCRQRRQTKNERKWATHENFLTVTMCSSLIAQVIFYARTRTCRSPKYQPRRNRSTNQNIQAIQICTPLDSLLQHQRRKRNIFTPA